MFSFRGIRHHGRSYSIIILIFTTISSSFLTIRLYHRDKQRQESIQYIPSVVVEEIQTLSSSSIIKTLEKNIRTGILYLITRIQ
jgi:AAA15 family ATPase/GTPase